MREVVDKLAVWLSANYQLEELIQVELLRSYSNDVYLITTPHDKYILKVYGLNWRTESEIQYEAALINHLAQKRLRVARPITGKDGEMVYKVATAKGEQYAVLFEYADGEKPQPPFSNELYFAFGEAIARVHEYSNDFVTEHSRTSLDLINIIESPLKVSLPVIRIPDDRAALLEAAQTVKNKMTALNLSQLDWGVIHGDATLDNLHVTDYGQIVLYDFDSGEPGWRAADLQGWAYHNTEYAEKWEAFKRGYASIRELKAIDLEAARYLSVAWLIWSAVFWHKARLK